MGWNKNQEIRAIARNTARCRWKFRHVGLSNFTTISCGFSATVRLCIQQRPFKCWNYKQYAYFHGRDAKSRR